jgi:enoyl reductase-like protein
VSNTTVFDDVKLVALYGGAGHICELNGGGRLDISFYSLDYLST